MKQEAKMANKSKTSTVDANKLLLTENSPFSVQEAYKTLRTNISFSLPGGGCKCIGVTSANRGDGKSSVAVNLGISFAQINKKVVVVDCDMRLPTVASKIGIPSKPGLSNFLVGDNGVDDLVIRRVEDMGIDVVPAGNIPPDPTKLLESVYMSNLMEVLRKHYDVIIIDLPPLTPVSDAAILSKYIDGYLIIVKHNVSEYDKVEDTLRQLEFANAKLIGFVYNGKTFENRYYKRGRKSYYYYDYYKKGNKKEKKKQQS